VMKDLVHLETFVVLAEELHVGRTAERLHVSPASVSQRLSSLEKDIGGSLAIRSTRHLELTELGKSLQEEASVLLDQFSSARRRLQAQASGSSGRLHLSFIGSVGTTVLPGLLRRLSEHIPDMSIEIGSQGFTAKIEELLTMRRTDIGIVRTPVRSVHLDWLPLYDDPLVAVLPSRHRCAAQPVVDLSQLAEDTHVVFPSRAGSVVAEQSQTMYRRAGFEPRKRIEVTETLTAIGLVGSGMGVAVMPLSTQRIGIPDVRYVRVKQEVMTQVAVVWRHDDSNPLRQRFVEELERSGGFLDSRSSSFAL
ncbi:MAG: LysR family transcriptional regulator, partial [Trueperella sp.]|nr:LysR family transcriptional regulator [Trueperella sp.]